MLDGFSPFLENITFPMVCTNIDDSRLPAEEKISLHMKKSIIVEISGTKVGIIGYVTTDTPVSHNSLLTWY